MQNTIKQYDYVINQCKDLFSKKMKDYGSAWRILRLSSLTDQIFIKAQRIRGLQQNDTRKVDEGQYSEFIGIINYSIMALIQIEKGIVEHPDLNLDQSLDLFNNHNERFANCTKHAQWNLQLHHLGVMLGYKVSKFMIEPQVSICTRPVIYFNNSFFCF